MVKNRNMTLDIFNTWEEYFKPKEPFNPNYLLLIVLIYFVVRAWWYYGGIIFSGGAI